MVYAQRGFEPGQEYELNVCYRYRKNTLFLTFFFLQVKVSDNGEISKHSICKVSVRVVPVSTKSKNPPSVKPPQPIKLTEGDDIGFLVATITAKDPDNDTLWYDIVGKHIMILIFEILPSIFKELYLDSQLYN